MKTEEQLREETVPTFSSTKELVDYIESLEKQKHDYGTCVYAMSMSAVAAFNYIARKLGVTGFQHSCADLDVIRRTRGIKGPFLIIDLEQALYPQYDLHERLQEVLNKNKTWLAEQAAERLQKNPEAHPAVLAHWQKLVSEKPNDSDNPA